MRSRRLIFTLVLVALVVAIGFVWREIRTRGVAAQTRHTLENQIAALRASTERAVARSKAAEVASAKHRATLEESRKAETSASVKSPAKIVRVQQRRPWIPERLQTEPEFQVLWLASRKAELSATYRPLFAQLRLSREEVEKFETIMLKRDEQMMDIQATQDAQKLRGDDPVLLRLRGRIVEEFRAAQKELLGAENVRALNEYERGVFAREMVAGIAGGAVTVAREPLSAQQAERLFEAIVNSSPAYQRGGTVNTNEIDWAVVDAEAQKVLSPSQFAYFKQAEPPLPVGGRFQNQLYQAVHAATKREAAVQPGK